MWLKLSIFLLLVHHLNATCDVCQPGKVACHSENTYSICMNGVPTRNDIICPVGYTCTGEKFICYPVADGYKPICKPGDSAPIDSSTTPESTNPESTTPESTTPDTNFKTFCTNNGNGNFKIENDPFCKSFIFCYNGKGQKRDCVSINNKETYFDGKECSLDKPDDCYTTPESTTPESTTPESTTPESTTPDTNYRAYCTEKGDGKFKNENDPSCLTFIFCLNGRGQKRDCQSVNNKETFFNGLECSLDKPDYCS